MLDSEKRIKGRIIEIYTIVIYLLSVIAFEIGYCNSVWIANLFEQNGYQYNFSMCRIVFYIVFLAIYFIFKKSFVEEAKEVSKNKIKRVFIYLSIVAVILSIVLTLVIALIKPEVLRGTTIGLITVLLGSLFMIYISNNHTKNIIVITCTFGMVFTIATSFNHAIDEKRHFITAFNVANFNLDYEQNGITDKKIEELPQITKFTNVDRLLEGKYEENLIPVNKEDSPSTATNYPFYQYIFPAIGIWVAKTIGGSVIDIYIAGRIFNLILYAILMIIAIKIIPFKKNIFTVLAFMPMILLLAASYSIDGYCIGVVFIFIAYCMKIYKQSKAIFLKQFAILVGLFLLMLTAKSMSYVFVGIIALMLPIIKTLKKNKKYLPIIIAVAVIMLIAIVGLLIYVKNTKLVADTRGGNTNTAQQLEILLNNPKHDIILATNQIKETLLNFNWYCMLHPAAFFTPDAPYLMFVIMLFVLYVALTENDYDFKLKNKVIMGISFLAVFAMTSLALYIGFTEVGEVHVAGYQTRYIIPILPLLLFGISSKRLKSEENKNRVMNVTIVTGAFLFISLLQLIIV